MQEEQEPMSGAPEEDPFELLHKHDVMKQFDELSFKQKWSRVFAGLKQPITSGEHKWARLQMLRLLSPLAAVLVPLLMLFLIAILAQFNPEPNTSTEVTIVEPTPMEDLEELEEPEIEELEPPEPVEMEMEVVSDAPSMSEDVNAPTADAASVQPAEFDSVAQVKSPVVMRGIMGSRNPGAQGAALGRYGGGHTVKSVLRALRWLAKNQNEDGSWGKDKPAMASLALLAYLAHGDTPASEEFGTTVEKALRFLVEAQTPDGHFKGKDGHDYTQPIAAYALAEAYGMTRVPMLKEAAVKAIEVVVKGQNPTGSFNYNLKPSDRDDLSYAGWCVQALKAASIAGLESEVPGIKEAKEKAVDGIKGHFRGNEESGVFGYKRGGGGSQGLTGVGILCLQFLGKPNDPMIRKGFRNLEEKYAFNWEDPPRGSIVYYWYYNTQAYFQVGGQMWDNWNKQFSHGLVEQQEIQSKEESGYVDHKGRPQETGFWTSPAEREHNAGNDEVMDTMLCTLMLEVYYRYLPTFQQVPEEEIEEELGSEDDLVIEIVSTSPARLAPERQERQLVAYNP